MTSCDACQSLQIRNILKLVQGDTSVDDEFQWFHLPEPADVTLEEENRMRSSNGMTALLGYKVLLANARSAKSSSAI